MSHDLPGSGALSADQGEISLARFSEEVGRVLLAIGKPTVILGHSMGAQIAERVAVANPGSVSALVLITPVPLGGVHAPPEVVESFKSLGGEPAKQREARRKLSYGLAPNDEERLGRIGEAVRPDVVSALVDAWNNGLPEGLSPSAFTGPVLIVRGAGDPFVTREVADAVADRFTGARTDVVLNAGHWAQVEQAETVAALIDEFLGTLTWRAGEAGAGTDWKDAFAKRSASAFAAAFAEDVTLEAAILFKPIKGRENVKRVMEAASRMYESLIFTDNAADGRRQYLEWTARAFGGLELDGVTVITRNEAGAISRIAIHHRPLGGALQFSAELGHRLRGVIDPSHFSVRADVPNAA